MDNENKKIEFPFSRKNSADIEPFIACTKEAEADEKNYLEYIMDDVAQSLGFAQELINVVRPEFENFTKMAQELSIAMLPVIEIVRQATASFAKTISTFRIPDITEDHKQELIISYKRWGEYGWTPYPNAPFDFFNKLPTCIEEANAVMAPFCSKNKMERLFDELYKQHIKKEDLDAAVLCYKNRQYKACALILFGVIDANLIRKQKRSKKRRPTGSTAAKNLREQFENGDNKNKLFTMLLCVNLFICLETIFANAYDFKIEPATVNRNFVSHGMTRRSVRQRDCNQLFLALYNLTLFFEFTS